MRGEGSRADLPASDLHRGDHHEPDGRVPPHHVPDHDLLHHHGDVEARGMRDFAVNVSVDAPPPFLRDALAAALTDLSAYPDATAATTRLADHLGVPVERVLLTNGAAEAFHLLARARPWQHPVVVHPQFTEPDTALRAAGHDPSWHVLPGPRYVLDADTFGQAHPAADLVVVGNPTNPTSVLHPAADLLRLRRTGRVLVVDEAFLDVVPREQDTLLRHAGAGSGVVVIRSLTKTFGLAGLRAGYIVGDPDLLAECARVQPHWSVNHLACVAVEAAASGEGVAHVEQVAGAIAAHRPPLVEGLRALGLEVVGTPTAPFVLAGHPRAAELRELLRQRGIAVRRADTFPGLGPTWMRIAVRGPQDTQVLLDALAAALESIGDGDGQGDGDGGADGDDTPPRPTRSEQA